ncbi:MAG: sulfatase-like hydrolase/transferase [Puniceicoccales bacterium]|nr:sulfatase-like hydrolase/transferase [Puniceicoccales bacterium]
MLLRLATLMILFSLARVLFFLCNYKFFADESAANIIKAFAAGVRFDAATVAIFNAPIIVFWALPLRMRSWKFPNILAEMWFLVLNFFALLVNTIDVKYFSFTFRRMGSEIFDQAPMLHEDSSIYRDIVVRYWHVIAIGIIFAWILCLCPVRLGLVGKTERIRRRDFAYFFIAVALLVIGIRGGLQGRPLKPACANIYAPTTQMASLVNNTAFNIFHTTVRTSVPRLRYFDGDDSRLCKFSPIHKRGNLSGLGVNFEGKNIFIIILESFSAEHIGALDNQFKESPNVPFTPFLDSLIEKSYVFDGFANGLISIDGLTSVLLGIPPLLNSSYILSAYSQNRMESLPSLLQKNGYKTLFFYGGRRNSCNFDSLRRKAQIEECYCVYDYDGPPSDISGWGVYDEEFFQFVAKKIDGVKKPFLSVLFTLSSHHPFSYPERLHGKFPKGNGDEPVQELIAYTDYSLRKFFETAEKMDWYKNTIFVLVADHISGPQERYYKSNLGGYSIPLIFFDPTGKLVGKSNEVAQQIDIMPTVLDLVAMDLDYFSFGSSLFDKTASRFAISYKNGVYQIITKDFVCRFDGQNVVEFYERSDFLLEKNLVSDSSYAEQIGDLGDFMKAFLQHYCESIRNNAMYVPPGFVR